MKNNILKIFYAIIIIGLLYSCGSSSKSGLSNLEDHYPDSRFLYAVGHGDNLSDAEKNAIGKLSIIFESKVNVDQTLTENYLEYSDDDVSTLEYKSKTQKRINLASNQKLMNVKTGEHFTDENGTVSVVAYINRSETAFIYEERIQNNNNTILSLEEHSKQSNQKIVKYASLNKATHLINENLGLLKQLSIISPNTVSYSEELDKYNSIKREKGKIASSIIFTFTSNSNEITNTLSNVLTSESFRIGKNGDYNISSSVNFEEVDLGRNEIFYTWEASIKFSEPNGDTIFAFKENGREGGKTESAALSRVKYTANQKTSEDFISHFEDYLNSLVGN